MKRALKVIALTAVELAVLFTMAAVLQRNSDGD